MANAIAGIPGRNWLQPPAKLLVLFLLTTLGFLVGLVWLGWNSLEDDEDIAASRMSERLDRAADGIEAELRQNLSDLEVRIERVATAPSRSFYEAVAEWSPRLGTDAVLVSIDTTTLEVFPRERLLYYPTLPAADEPFLLPLPAVPPGPLSSLEAAEVVEHWEGMAQSDDKRVRAAALLAVARTRANAGRLNAALATYAELQSPDLLVDGRPAELLARLARALLLSEAGRQEELVREVSALRRDLHGGRWQLTRAAYEHYSTEVGELSLRAKLPASADLPETEALALAAAAEFLWKQWHEQALVPAATTGRLSRVWHGHPVFLIWRSTPNRLTMLVGGEAFLRRELVQPLSPLLDREGVRIEFEDIEGNPTVPHERAGASGPFVLRTLATTRLPWNLRVVSADPDQDQAQRAMRRQLVIAALVFLALFVSGGSYLSVRAVMREIEAARVKSDFVAAVSHEFRTPLTTLRQFSDLLADGRIVSEQERGRCYAALQRGTRRLTRLVEDLLDFARMEAGSRQYHFERLDAKEWLGAVVAEFQEEAASRGYAVEVSWEGASSATITADRESMSRALWNLLDNAVKYSPVVKTIWVSGTCRGNRLAVDVRDRGIGVAESEQKAIFRKFVRGSAGASEVVKGTGLGLALVQQIVEAHSGSIQLDSTEGAGSTFSIILPAVVEADVEEHKAWRAS